VQSGVEKPQVIPLMISLSIQAGRLSIGAPRDPSLCVPLGQREIGRFGAALIAPRESAAAIQCEDEQPKMMRKSLKRID
jgi:hypothetical protein